MNDNWADSIRVAPREISDYVFRVAQLAGLDGGQAEAVARNVRFAEVVYGEAINDFISSVEGSAMELGGLATSPFVSASREFAHAEAAHVEGGAELTIHFDPPLPRAALAKELFDALVRGTLTDLEHDSADPISDLTIRHGDIPVTCTEAVNQRATQAAAEGVTVASETFDRLVELAKPYLVAESQLDDAINP